MKKRGWLSGGKYAIVMVVLIVLIFSIALPLIMKLYKMLEEVK